MARTFYGEPGDLIQIQHGLYWHWAVYIGGQEVVHFTTEGPMTFIGTVKRENFAKVVGSHSYQVNNQLDNIREARDPSIIVKEARAMVGRKFLYSILIYNCEHFATEMRYGKKTSDQGILAAMLASVTVAGVALVVEAPVVVVGALGVGVVSGLKKLPQGQVRGRSVKLLAGVCGGVGAAGLAWSPASARHPTLFLRLRPESSMKSRLGNGCTLSTFWESEKMTNQGKREGGVEGGMERWNESHMKRRARRTRSGGGGSDYP
ncbi:unnamed protein product [Pleuronectes platessa]|uniref:LRAT domain-containing protein n=1 Tax=Pleuronectes platessa TaxID=8262 RepID=A0A9N7UW63_PLEPL|nr:unnamed protein product [Pleuronectes platessa]